MTQVIVFKRDDGGLSVIHPAPEILERHTVTDIALKDVPSGRPFKIMDASAVPPRSERAGWSIPDADLNDGFGADYEFFPEG